jgi:hypothetical protein
MLNLIFYAVVGFLGAAVIIGLCNGAISLLSDEGRDPRRKGL